MRSRREPAEPCAPIMRDFGPRAGGAAMSQLRAGNRRTTSARLRTYVPTSERGCRAGIERAGGTDRRVAELLAKPASTPRNLDPREAGGSLSLASEGRGAASTRGLATPARAEKHV